MGAAKNKGGLGFRDLTLFNKALLAKQVWRLSQNPDSLAAKIFKAKYHGSCTILEANVGNKPSLVWRSFMSAQEIINRGNLESRGREEHKGEGGSLVTYTYVLLGSVPMQCPARKLTCC
jgi:hypothetical protein